MMLSSLLDGIASVSTEQDCAITSISLDSREAVEGSLFVALKGTQQHGINYATEVAKSHGAAIIWESDDTAEIVDIELPQIEVVHLRDFLGEIANRFYQYPSKSLDVIGITGTDGKTSVSHFVSQAMDNCAVMGTLGIGLLNNLQKATHTTPDVLNTHKNIAVMRSNEISTLAMEVSSHALDQARVAGVEFDVAVLTNLTRDHLDYHITVEAYAEAKAKLFSWPSLKAVVLNADDAFGQKIANQILNHKHSIENTNERSQVQVIPYSVNKISASDSDISVNTLVATEAVFNAKGITAKIQYGEQTADLMVSVLGRFNLSNLLAALASMMALGDSLKSAAAKLSKVHTVAGRMEKVSDADVLAVIDYAHTPNALETVLKALREHTKNQLICVFGCGGDRDSGKRPLMAKIAEENADVVIVTDDNPRSESPESIVVDIMKGFDQPGSVIVEHDRAIAIGKALKNAQSGDTVLIAGKGHENVQILATGSIPFSDREQANKILQELAA